MLKQTRINGVLSNLLLPIRVTIHCSQLDFFKIFIFSKFELRVLSSGKLRLEAFDLFGGIVCDSLFALRINLLAWENSQLWICSMTGTNEWLEERVT